MTECHVSRVPITQASANPLDTMPNGLNSILSRSLHRLPPGAPTLRAVGPDVKRLFAFLKEPGMTDDLPIMGFIASLTNAKMSANRLFPRCG